MEKQIQKWSDLEAKKWKSEQLIKRSYKDEVVTKIQSLEDRFIVSKYGKLDYDQQSYALYIIKSKDFNKTKPNILITGGVHGYETSGVHGALKFMSEKAQEYEKHFNFICVPCISPWGYETINRWNPDAIDPNRNFTRDSKAQECSKIYNTLQSLDLNFLAHFDLHETTDTDNTVFRPDLEKRDGIKQDLWEIPDGFYLVADTYREENEFQDAIINSVEKITHIAPTDDAGKIIGVKPTTRATINYDVKDLKLCAGLTDAKYVTTTEVYPDSPKVTDEECNLAQVAAVTGGLDFLLGQL